jgi:hypothetical protein
LFYNTTTSLWEKKSIATVLGYTPYNGTDTSIKALFSATTPLSYSNGVYSISQATTSSNGYLSSTDWNTFNNKSSTLGTVTSVAMTMPLGLSVSGSPITTSGTFGITLTAGYVIPSTTSTSEWGIAYNNRITSLTVTGSSGSATLASNVLNIPTYTLVGLGGQVALNGTGFVKISGTTISYDNSTYLTTASASSTYQTIITNPVTGTGTTNELAYFNTASTIASLAVATYPSLTELAYVKGVTSAIQTQLNAKASTLSGTTNYISKFTSSSAIGNSLLYSDSVGVGINTTAPNYSLQVNSSTTSNRIQLTNTSSGTAGADGLQIGQSGLDAYISNREAGAFDIETSGVARLSIASTGAATFSGGGIVNINGTSATNNSLQGYLDLRDGNGNELAIIRGYRGAGGNSGILKIYTGLQATILALTIDENQSVGIGTSAPNQVLHIRKDGGTTGINIDCQNTSYQATLYYSRGGVGKWEMGMTSSLENWYLYGTGNSIYVVRSTNNVLINSATDNGYRLYVVGTIYATGNITANSDLTLKKNLKLIDNPIDKLMQLNGYAYQWKSDDSHQYGVIAQEVEKILPYAVSTGNDGIKGVSYNQITPLLIEGFKSHESEITQLKKKVKFQQAEIDILKSKLA